MPINYSYTFTSMPTQRQIDCNDPKSQLLMKASSMATEVTKLKASPPAKITSRTTRSASRARNAAAATTTTMTTTTMPAKKRKRATGKLPPGQKGKSSKGKQVRKVRLKCH